MSNSEVKKIDEHIKNLEAACDAISTFLKESKEKQHITKKQYKDDMDELSKKYNLEVLRKEHDDLSDIELTKEKRKEFNKAWTAFRNKMSEIRTFHHYKFENTSPVLEGGKRKSRKHRKAKRGTRKH